MNTLLSSPARFKSLLSTNSNNVRHRPIGLPVGEGSQLAMMWNGVKAQKELSIFGARGLKAGTG